MNFYSLSIFRVYPFDLLLFPFPSQRDKSFAALTDMFLCMQGFLQNIYQCYKLDLCQRVID